MLDYHLDYRLRLQAEPKYKSLYNWAINEVEADGSPIDRDQIPWVWTLYFSASSCELTNRLEIAAPFSLRGESEDPPRIKADQVIRMTLRPSVWRNRDVTFSMFGTKRSIQNFTLEVRRLSDSAEAEHCSAWGGVSYTAEIDFRYETTDDCIWFYLYVKPETFARYVDLIDGEAIDSIEFSVGSVDGFYSEWSPSISTDKVKVLLSGDEHKLDLPPDFQGEPLRLGRVRDARLLLHRRLELGKGRDHPPGAEPIAEQLLPLEHAEEGATMNATTGMFGMLDYRASKLYRLLSFPLRLLCIIGGFLFLASCVFFTGHHFTGYPSPIAHFLLMTVAATIGSILWWLLLVSVWGLFHKIFFFLIDVVPAEGRTQEQAVAVVKVGNGARYAFRLDNHFMEWTDDDSRGYVRSQALSVRLLYGNKLRQQISAIAQALRDAKKEGLSPYDTTQRVTAAKGKTGWCEKLVVNRGWFRDYGLLLAVFALYYYFGLG